MPTFNDKLDILGAKTKFCVTTVRHKGQYPASITVEHSHNLAPFAYDGQMPCSPDVDSRIWAAPGRWSCPF
jgi:hypothetical protein